MNKIMRKMITGFLQYYANFLIKKLQTSQTNDEFDFWYKQAVNLDIYCKQLGFNLK